MVLCPIYSLLFFTVFLAESRTMSLDLIEFLHYARQCYAALCCALCYEPVTFTVAVGTSDPPVLFTQPRTVIVVLRVGPTSFCSIFVMDFSFPLSAPSCCVSYPSPYATNVTVPCSSASSHWFFCANAKQWHKNQL